jgi:uncharacterized iron-regulated protein
LRTPEWNVHSAWMKERVALAAGLVLLAGGCTAGWTGSQLAPVAAGSSPRSTVRVVESSSGRQITLDDLITTASLTDVVFVGEQHDDPETHFAEFALLEGIGRQRSRIVLSLEMFERDVQPALDDYLAGRMSEADFLATSRPWDRYATDYRPLVMLARARGWPVVASNVPRSIASAVSRRGLTALDTLPETSRVWAARNISCPHDAYYARFADEMKGHPAGGPPPAMDPTQIPARVDRFYDAQCVRDETMAESIYEALAKAGEGAIIVHFNGAFHSDYRQGTVARALRHSPNMRSLVITVVPTVDPSSASIADNAPRADYVIFTRKGIL